jgi:hypothetical protein
LVPQLSSCGAAVVVVGRGVVVVVAGLTVVVAGPGPGGWSGSSQHRVKSKLTKPQGALMAWGAGS